MSKLKPCILLKALNDLSKFAYFALKTRQTLFIKFTKIYIII